MTDLQPSDTARKALGIRLRNLRLDAGLSGQQLADRTGFSPSKISRAENGIKNLPEADMATWAIACEAEGDIPELIAARREVEQTWQLHRQRLKLGQVAIQSQGLPIFEQAKLVRVYESMNIPGVLQTFAYAREQRLLWARTRHLRTDDVDEAARTRLVTQRLVFEGPTAFSFLIEAPALYTVLCDADVMAEQYDLLLRAASRPNVALGVIPLGTTRRLFPGESIYLFDDRFVWQDFWVGVLRTSQSADVASFAEIFTVLRKDAVYGAAAREEIEAARRFVQSLARP